MRPGVGRTNPHALENRRGYFVRRDALCSPAFFILWTRASTRHRPYRLLSLERPGLREGVGDIGRGVHGVGEHAHLTGCEGAIVRATHIVVVNVEGH